MVLLEDVKEGMRVWVVQLWRHHPCPSILQLIKCSVVSGNESV